MELNLSIIGVLHILFITLVVVPRMLILQQKRIYNFIATIFFKKNYDAMIEFMEQYKFL